MSNVKRKMKKTFICLPTANCILLVVHLSVQIRLIRVISVLLSLIHSDMSNVKCETIIIYRLDKKEENHAKPLSCKNIDLQINPTPAGVKCL